MLSPCLIIPVSKGESIRKKLTRAGLLDYTLLILKEEGHLLLPLKGEEPTLMDLVQDVVPDPVIEVREIPEGRETLRSYRDLVSIPEDLRPLLPSAFDVVGNVAVVKFQEELGPYMDHIGDAMLKAHPNLRTVVSDTGVAGDFRIRHLEIVTGGPSLETIHTESGLRLQMDLGKVYFSPRLATERLRVARQVGESESVCDLFAGIGPFSLQIARMHPGSRVTACDMNPDAIHFLKRNIELNKVHNVIPVLTDAKDLLSNLLPQDRFIMNLPHSSFDFIPDVLPCLKDVGTIHYYEILGESKIDRRRSSLIEEGKRSGLHLEVLSQRKVKSYSPSMAMLGLDIKTTRF